MRIIPLSLALATLVAAPGAFAQSSPQAQSWDNEPSGFLGVPFQGDFKAQVAECPDNSPRQSTLCRTSTSDPERYEIHGLPYIPINSGYQLFAALKNGAISQLMLTGNASSLELDFPPFTREDLYRPDDPGAKEFLAFINAWVELSAMLNELSRSMGQVDLYPFVLGKPVVAKLHFIHLRVTQPTPPIADQAGAALP